MSRLSEGRRVRMRTALVTGYIQLSCPHRSHQRYLELGEALLRLGLPTVAFLEEDSAKEIQVPTNATIRPASREACWLYQDSVGAGLPVPLGGKDTPAYFSVVHQKTAWLAEALEFTSAELLVWVDFGILHLPTVSPAHILDFMARLQSSSLDRIAAASIWPLNSHSPLTLDSVQWYLAGGVLATPRRAAPWLDAAVKKQAREQLLLHGALTWEVNTWAFVARRHPERFQLYQADHDQTLFTGFSG